MSERQHHYTLGRNKGRPVIFENGVPRPVAMYMPGTARDNIAREDVDRFLEAGLTTFYLQDGREFPNGEQQNAFWQGVDTWTTPRFVSPERFTSISERAEYIIARCSEARFFVRFGTLLPEAWRRAYPGEMAVSEEGAIMPDTSLASLQFACDFRKFLLHMIGWIERQPWAWRVIGYVTLNECEGTRYHTLLGSLYDYSEPMKRAYREFAPEWGGTIPLNRFGSVARPEAYHEWSPQAVEHELRAKLFHWPDPQSTGAERAYFMLVRQLFLQRCRDFIATAQEALAGRQVLLGMDALKQGLSGWLCVPFFFGPPPRPHHANPLLASGSFGADEFLDIPGFNLHNTPHDYAFRQMGGAPEPEGIVDSAILRGQFFLAEDDSRTYLASENESYGFYRNAREARAGMWRNAAAAIARGYQTYWMDVTSFPSPRGGYFRSTELMSVVREIVPVLERSIRLEHQDVPAIAMVIDDASGLEEDFSCDYQHLAVIQQRLAGLNQCGLPYRIYLWEDLLSPDFPDHRLIIFPNLFRIDEERHRILKERVCRDGRVILWGPGTGITNGEKLSAEWAGKVTGIPMTLLHESYSRQVVLTRCDHPITRNLSMPSSYGDSRSYGPILLPEWESGASEQGVVLTVRGTHRPGLVIREINDDDARWTSIFTAAVPVPAVLIREMARHAGAHVYSEENDVIMASRSFLAIHSVRGGRRLIRLPSACAVRDVMTGALLSECTETLEIEIDPPETRLFYLGEEALSASS